MTWTLGNQRKGYDGYLLLSQQGSSTVYAFEPNRWPLSYTDNNGYERVIDNSAVPHDKVLGVRSGILSFTSPVKLDRGWYSFLTAAFGPRTGGAIAPFGATILPSSADSAYSFGNIYFTTIGISGGFDLNGRNSAIRAAVRGLVMDPLNVGEFANLTPPSASGTSGVGVSSFAQTSFTNGASSGLVTYDSVRSFRWSASNEMSVQPSVSDPTNRLAPGCIPGMLTGRVALTQAQRASNAIPFTTGLYPIQIVMLSGDGSQTWRLSTSTSWDSQAATQDAADYNMRTAQYSFFGTNSISSEWPFASADS